MSSYVYRGVSMKAALDQELGPGVIEGHTSTIRKGKLDVENPQATVARGTPVDELNWWMPEGEDRPFLVEKQGVTGGLTHVLGTAISFSNPPVPLVFYLKESRLNGTAARVRYAYDWFDSYPAALDWVYGQSVSGEVRTLDEGLMALTTETANGPEIWEWGHDQLGGSAMAYEDERELLVFADHIDVAPCCDGVAIVFEGTRNPTTSLASFEGYHAGYETEGVDVSLWSRERRLDALHAKVREASNQPISNLWTINLSTTLMSKLHEIPESAFDYAYDGQRVIEDYDEVPDWLLGRD